MLCRHPLESAQFHSVSLFVEAPAGGTGQAPSPARTLPRVKKNERAKQRNPCASPHGEAGDWQVWAEAWLGNEGL
jgi:hypothetical protein